MRIIQSYWSKPILDNSSSRSFGGWSDKKFDAICWSLSFYQLKKYHNSIELYTDNYGAEYLVGKLGLKYDKVIIVPEFETELNKYGTELWAMGKVFVYSMQTEPFIHVDGDLFVNEQLSIPKGYELLVQNIESNYDIYKEINNDRLINNIKFNKEVESLLKENSAYNMGVFGINNLSLLKKYSSFSLDTLHRFYEKINKSQKPINYNMFIEQSLLYVISNLNNINVYPKFGLIRKNKQNDIYRSISNIYKFYSNQAFIHMFGDAKIDKSSLVGLEKIFSTEYHEQYQKINYLLKKGIL